MARIAYYRGRPYRPVLKQLEYPTGDNALICDQYDRLMLKHDFNEHGSDTLFIAPKGTFCSGFVVGIFVD